MNKGGLNGARVFVDEAGALSEEACFRAVVENDARLDGAFYYAVRSTGIYCKPSCPSKPPRRAQVRFFRSPEDAESAGFRACLRCRPRSAAAPDPRSELVERACRLIENSEAGALSLAQLGAELGVSPYHLQRTFKKIVGLSPREYAHAHRVRKFKTGVKGGETVTGAMYDAGYSSSSRLYERAAADLGMTPASYARGGAGARISYIIAACQLGHILLAATDRGLCAVRLGDSREELEATLREEFPEAEIDEASERVCGYFEIILAYLAGGQRNLDLPLDVRATAFQRRVWGYLQTIPYGESQSYGQVAAGIGHPRAVRAVARACAGNSVALVIPCHRVIRGSGEPGGYRWGLSRKQALLDKERTGGLPEPNN